MCRLDRAWREKDEGRGGVERTKEARKWDEGPTRQVKERRPSGDLFLFMNKAETKSHTLAFCVMIINLDEKI